MYDGADYSNGFPWDCNEGWLIFPLLFLIYRIVITDRHNYFLVTRYLHDLIRRNITIIQFTRIRLCTMIRQSHVWVKTWKLDHTLHHWTRLDFVWTCALLLLQNEIDDLVLTNRKDFFSICLTDQTRLMFEYQYEVTLLAYF